MPSSNPILKLITDEQLARFHASYEPDPAGCWVWRASRDSKGYGRLRIRNRHVGAHRISFAVHNGREPGGLFVCHACDNPPCVNPAHLWLGTAADNNHDARAKGRLYCIYSRTGGSIPPPGVCIKCGHLRTDDVPAYSHTPARCRNCVRVSRADYQRRRRLARTESLT